MRTIRLRGPLALLLLGGLAACSKGEGPVTRAPVDPLTILEAKEVGEVMLAVAQPEEAVLHFQRVAAARPDDAAAKRGLATSLMRARRYDDAVRAWSALAEDPAAEPADRVSLAEALVRTEAWEEAGAALDEVPADHRTARRFRLEAMLADVDGAWERADGLYEAAAGASAEPAGILNNWGFSKLSRGDARGAERLFERALEADSKLFTAKNNLAMARGARGEYEVPLVPMTQTERATILHTLALTAVKSGDVAMGRSLLRDALDTHPRHFEPAARALAALEAGEAPAPDTLAEAPRRLPTDALDAMRRTTGTEPLTEPPSAARVIDASAAPGELFP